MEKYIIICVAGQSNAVGYDESPVTEENLYCADPNRIKQLGFLGEDNLKVVPLDYCAQSMQNLRVYNRADDKYPGTKGIHLPLANLLLPHIPEDYGLLFLSVAYGGCGFTVGQDAAYDSVQKKPVDSPETGQPGPYRWGKDTAYYQTLRDRIVHALSMNPENRFGAFLWCQGENDSEDPDGHYKGFCEMTEQLFEELNHSDLKNRPLTGKWDKDLWYNMETVFYWYTVGQCTQIWENYKHWNPDTYIPIPRSVPSNEINGTGETAQNRDAHFGDNSYEKIIAPLVLEKLLANNTLNFR